MSSRPPIPRNVWTLGLVSLLMDLSSEIYHALLPAFVTLVLGLPVTALGALDGVAEATASFGKLFSGRLSDRSQHRKPWIMAGYGLAALSKPLFPLATSGPLVLAARFTDRIGVISVAVFPGLAVPSAFASRWIRSARCWRRWLRSGSCGCSPTTSAPFSGSPLSRRRRHS